MIEDFLKADDAWYHKREDRILGPFHQHVMESRANNGKIQRDDYLRKGTIGVWVKASETQFFPASPNLSSPSTIAENPLLASLRNAYHNALSVIDRDVKELVEQGKEMRAVSLANKSLDTIYGVRETLSSLYMMIYRGQDVLKHFQSEKLRQYGGQLPAISRGSFEKSTTDFVLNVFNNMGIPTNKSHWLIEKIAIVEIEFMFDVLAILVEPDYIPGGDGSIASDDDDGQRIDRYIPSNVRIFVWRRDQGHCVMCRSQERLEYDHIIPISKGGSNTERNIQLLCETCNRKKSDSIV